MRINIPNNKRNFVDAEEVRDRCVVTSAATATWRKLDVVDAQFRGDLALQSKCLVAPDEDRLTEEERPCCRRRGSCL